MSNYYDTNYMIYRGLKGHINPLLEIRRGAICRADGGNDSILSIGVADVIDGRPVTDRSVRWWFLGV